MALFLALGAPTHWITLTIHPTEDVPSTPAPAPATPAPVTD